jgi:hypothetical protein
MRFEKEVRQALQEVYTELDRVWLQNEPLIYFGLNIAAFVLEWVLEEKTGMVQGFIQQCRILEEKLSDVGLIYYEVHRRGE